VGFKSLVYFFKEAWRGVRYNGWMSIASVGVVALTLLLLGLFVLMNMNISFITEELESQVEIITYLESGLSELDLQQVRQELLSIPEVAEVEYVSEEMALERLRDQLGEDADLLLGYGDTLENPLPSSYEVKTIDPNDVPVVAGRIKNLDGIDRVDYGAGLVERLFKVTSTARWAGSAFMLLLAASATFLIAHTIRLTIYVRRKEIMIMKYVGATNWFVRWPFLIEGLILGIVGSLLPIIVLNYGYQVAEAWTIANIPFVSLVPIKTAVSNLLTTLLPLGAVLGGLGSILSLSRYLSV